MSDKEKDILDSSTIDIDDAPIPKMVKPRKKWWLQIALSLVILICGIAIGGAVAVGMKFHLAKEGFQRPEDISKRIIHRIQREFNVSKEQEKQLEEIFTKRLGIIRDLRMEYQPKIHEQMDAIRQEVTDILTPEQAEKWSKRFRGYERMWMGPRPPDSPGRGLGPGGGFGNRFRGGEGPGGPRYRGGDEPTRPDHQHEPTHNEEQ